MNLNKLILNKQQFKTNKKYLIETKRIIVIY